MRRREVIVLTVLSLLVGVPLIAETGNTKQTGTAKLQVAQCALKVKGMTCDGCAGMVEKGLLKVEGVKSAKVNFKSSDAEVEFDPKKITPEKIVADFNKANPDFRIELGKSKGK